MLGALEGGTKEHYSTWRRIISQPLVTQVPSLSWCQDAKLKFLCRHDRNWDVIVAASSPRERERDRSECNHQSHVLGFHRTLPKSSAWCYDYMMSPKSLLSCNRILSQDSWLFIIGIWHRLNDRSVSPLQYCLVSNLSCSIIRSVSNLRR